MRILGFDPGKTTGIADWYAELPWDLKESPGFLYLDELDQESLFEFLFNEIEGVDLVVIEDYKVRTEQSQRGFKHRWSAVGPARVIGAIQFACWIHHIPTVLQQPSIKAIGYSMAKNIYGVQWQKRHQNDAAAHVIYHVVRKLSEGEYPANAKGITKKPNS